MSCGAEFCRECGCRFPPKHREGRCNLWWLCWLWWSVMHRRVKW